jgi:hypothetical protein
VLWPSQSAGSCGDLLDHTLKLVGRDRRHSELVQFAVGERAVRRVRKDEDPLAQIGSGAVNSHLLVVELGEQRIDPCQPHSTEGDIRADVVAGHDHLAHEITEGRLQPGGERLDQAGASAVVVQGHLLALVEVEQPGLGIAIGQNHDGDLDHARGVHRLVGVDRDIAAGRHVLCVDADARVQGGQAGKDVVAQLARHCYTSNGSLLSLVLQW